MNDPNRKTEIFIIGAPKCATSAVARVLSLHPQIAFCSVKEPRFFSNDGSFAQGLDWYHGLFGDAAGLRAEGSTSYGEAWQERRRISAERIRAYNPTARIIYCVRHPLERAISEWREIAHQLRSGNPYIEGTYGIRTQTNVDADLEHVPGYLDTSNYWETIGFYRRHFDDSRIHVVFQEDWARMPALALARILRFIGVDDGFSPAEMKSAVNDKWLKARPRPLLNLFRRMPGYHVLAEHAPRGIKEWVRPLFKHHPDAGIVVSRNTTLFAQERIGADSARFLEWCGRSRDHWSW